MSRDEGFPIGDRSTRTLYDVRLVRAARKVGLSAVVAWDAIVDASWEAGHRVTFADAVDILPYDLGDTDAVLAALVSIGLLADDGCIREESWQTWYQPAYDRREERREAGRRGGLAKARNLAALEQSQSTGVAEPYPSVPSVPSVPSLPSVPRASHKNGDDPVAETLFGVYGGNPSKAVMEWGDRLATEYGAEAAARAIGEAATTGREKLMSRAEGSLKLVARAADRTEEAEERERLRQKRAAVRLPTTIVDPAPEKVSEIMENIAKSLGTARKEVQA
jgi:hypothetical protein